MNYRTFIPIMESLGFVAEAEYKFHDTRKFRFDFAFPLYKVAVEIEGGVWSKGRHTRGSGFIKDMEKYNLATSMGWSILRYTPSDLGLSATYDQIKKTILSK